MKNKTASYHRHVSCPPILLKMPFERMKTFLFLPKYCLHKFLIFLNSKIFWFFCQKTWQIKWKRHFKKQYHLICSLQQIWHLYRFWKKMKLFSKKPIVFFSKNPNFIRFQKAHYKFLWSEPSFLSSSEHSEDIINWQVSVKKRSDLGVLSGRFSFHIMIMGGK